MSVTVTRSRNNRECDEAEESPRALRSGDSLCSSLGRSSLVAVLDVVRRRGERGPFQSHPCRVTDQATWAGLKGAGRSIPPGRSKHRSEARSAASPGAVERPGAFEPVEMTTENTPSTDTETET